MQVCPPGPTAGAGPSPTGGAGPSLTAGAGYHELLRRYQDRLKWTKHISKS
jgi:hypothetical protein